MFEYDGAESYQYTEQNGNGQRVVAATFSVVSPSNSTNIYGLFGDVYGPCGTCMSNNQNLRSDVMQGPDEGDFPASDADVSVTNDTDSVVKEVLDDMLTALADNLSLPPLPVELLAAAGAAGVHDLSGADS